MALQSRLRRGNGKGRKARATVEPLEMRRLLTAAVWTGAANDARWADPANWQGDVAPAVGQDVVLPANTAYAGIDTTGSHEVGNLTLSGSYELSGGQIVVDGDIAANSSTGIIGLTLNHNTQIDVAAGATLAVQMLGDNGNGYGVLKEDSGTLDLQGDNTYTGPTEVSTGVLQVDLGATVGSPITVDSGASLVGAGTVSAVTVSGGTLSTINDSSTGTLTTAGATTLASGSTLALGYVQSYGAESWTTSGLTATGSSVEIHNAQLSVSALDGSFLPYNYVVPVIVNQTGVPVIGTFAGLPQGSTFTAAGVTYQITYHGGASGMDVDLQVISVTDYWVGQGPDDQWTDAANWYNGQVPADGDNVEFPDGYSNGPVDLGNQNVVVDNLTVNAFMSIGDGNLQLIGDLNDSRSLGFNGTVVLDGNNTFDITDQGQLSLSNLTDNGGGYGLTIDGNGQTILMQSNYSGPTEVAGGDLELESGSASATNVDPAATLTTNPGSSIPTLNSDGGNVFAIDYGTQPGVAVADGVYLANGAMLQGQYSTLQTQSPAAEIEAEGGTVNITGASFSMQYENGFTPAVGTVFTLIANDTGNAIIGTFAGLPQGADKTINGITYQVSYTGGESGQDVTATVVQIASVWRGGSGNWSDPANWQYGQVPGVGADVTISTGADTTIEVNVDSPIVLNSLDAGNVVLSGDDITFTGDGEISATGTCYVIDRVTLATDITLTGDFTIFGGVITDGGAGYGITVNGGYAGFCSATSAGGGKVIVSPIPIIEEYLGPTVATNDSDLVFCANLSSQVDYNNGSHIIGFGQVFTLSNTELSNQPSSFIAADPSTQMSDTLSVTQGVSFSPHTAFQAILGGAAAGDGVHPDATSELVVTGGTINITGANLTLVMGTNYVPSPGDVITLIKNQTGSPIIGTFSGLAEGAITSSGGYDFRVGYHGGTSGRDMTLTPLFGNHLTVAGPPTTTVNAGASLGSISVQLIDSAGNVAADDSSRVTLTARSTSGGAGMLSGTNSVAANAGVATFTGLSLSQPGTYVLVASDGTLGNVTSATITVTAAPEPTPLSIVVAGQPVPASVIAPPLSSPPTKGKSSENAHVTVRFENTAAGGEGSFTATLTLHNGQVKSKSLRFIKTGVYNEQILTASGATTTRQVEVIPTSPQKLIFTTQPAGLSHVNAVVAAVDRFGNIATADDGQTVTLQLAHRRPGQSIAGVSTAVITDGYATFSGLALTTDGPAQLMAIDGKLRPALSTRLD